MMSEIYTIRVHDHPVMDAGKYREEQFLYKRQSLAKIKSQFKNPRPVVFFLDGEQVEDLKKTFVKPGSMIDIVPEVGFWFELGAAIWWAVGVALDIAWIVGVTMLCDYIGGQLFGQDSQEPKTADRSGGQSYAWNPHTKQQEGIPRPRAYGKNMHYGNIIAKWTDVVSNREKLYMIIDHGEGPTAGIGSNTVYINDQPYTNYSGVTIQERLGTFDQTVMTGFSQNKLEYVLNTAVTNAGGAFTWTTPNDFFEDIEYTIVFPNGMGWYDKDGDLKDIHITIKVEISEHGEDDWTTIFNTTIGGATLVPKYVKHVVSDLGFSVVRGTQYDLKYTRTSADTFDDPSTSNFNIRSIREVVDVAFTHPGRAIIGISAMPSEQLSGNLNAKVIREDKIVLTYNGTNWIIQYSRNRAWVVLDILTQPVIVGNGGGIAYSVDHYEGIDPSRIDLAFFYEWAEWCDTAIPDGYGGTEIRMGCDIIIDYQSDIYSQAHELAEVGRTHLYWQGNTLTGWTDKAVTTPIDLVTMDNIMARSWKSNWVPKAELAGTVETYFNDEKLGYIRTHADYTNESSGLYTRSISIEGAGITTRGMAVHCGYHALERNRLIRNINKFRVGKDGFRYSLGNTIRIQHVTPDWGDGYRVVSAVDTDTLQLDRAVSATHDDLVYVRSFDEATQLVSIDSYTVDSVAGSTMTIQETWDPTPIKGNSVAIGVAGAIHLRRIIEMEMTVDNFFDITCETYDVDLFDADSVDPLNPNAGYIWPFPATGIARPASYGDISELLSQLLPPQPDIEFPMLSNCLWTGSAGTTVAWSKRDGVQEILFRFRGVSYNITADSTTDEFIYWDPSYTTTFRHTNVLTTAIDTGHWLMCRNVAGVAYPANAMQTLHGGLIQAGTITASKIIIAGINALSLQNAPAEAGADVTSTHQAATIASQGDLAVLDVVGGAYIDELAVDTLHIAGNAVTVPTGNYTSGALNYTDSDWHIAQTITFTTHGSPVLLIFSLCYYVSEDAEADIRIQRDNSVDVYTTRLCGEPAAGQGVYRSFSATVIETPTAASHTYDLDISCYDPGFTGFVYFKNRSLVGIEVKK